MIKTALFNFFIIFSFSAAAQGDPRDLIPVIDYMRTTPAWMNGHVTMNANHDVFEDRMIKLKLIKGKAFKFLVKEDELHITPLNAFSLRYLGFTVKVKEVSWSLRHGFKTKSELPLDITGLSRNSVSLNVADSLERILGEKMRLANRQLHRVRGMKEFGTTAQIIREIVRIFSMEGGSPVPTYYGEAGISFFPKTNKVFSLDGMRVGLKKGDSFRIGFKYNGNYKTVYPYQLTVDSHKGVDINQGKKFKQNARIVFKYLEMDKEGTRIEIHLGASESIGTILTAAEVIARASGRPVASCHECYELAQLPPIRLAVEGQFRAALKQQVDTYTSRILELNVNPRHLASWKRKESCRITAAESTRQCRLKVDGDANIRNCIKKVEQRMNSCLR